MSVITGLQLEGTASNAPTREATVSDTSIEKDTAPVPTPTTVVNLSGCPLSPDEVQLLSRGLSFCPTPPHLNTTQVLDDLERYNRRLRLKEFFADKEEDVSRPFRPPSHWMPPKGRDDALEVYISQVRTEWNRVWRPGGNIKQRTTLHLENVAH